MFGPPGYVYVYRSYGIHWCMNFVCEAKGSASAVLIRAIEPTEGLAADAPAARAVADARLLCSGPGRLCEALRVTAAHNGLALDAPPFELFARTRARSRLWPDRDRPHQGGRHAVALRREGLALSQQAVSDSKTGQA